MESQVQLISPNPSKPIMNKVSKYRKVENLRKILLQNRVELNEYVGTTGGRMPVFGYPLVCYSPHHTQHSH